MTAPALDVVLDVLAEDLEAAAYTEDGASLGGPARERVRQPPFPQPLQRPYGPARARDDDEIGVRELLRPVHEPHDHTRLGGQRVHVGEVGHQRDRADGDPQHVLADRRRHGGLADRAPQGDAQSVLLVDAEPVPEGQHAVRPPPGEVTEHVQPRLQQPGVAPELVHQEPGDQLLVLGREQGDGAEEGGEHASAVDVADDEHGQPRVPRDPHVDDVGPPQVDLGRAPRPLTDHRVIRAPQLCQAVQHRAEQALLAPAVVPARAQLAHRLAQQHHLAALFATGLEQHRVHQRGRLDAARLGLHGLRPADLRALARDERVQGHVLRLERRDLHALADQPAADAGRHDALARVGGGAGDEETTVHFPRPFRRARAASVVPSARRPTRRESRTARSMSVTRTARPVAPFSTGRCSTRPP